MQSLIKLLARSRKVELDVILSQFGALIGQDNLQQIRQDLADLEETLAGTGPDSQLDHTM